MRWGVENAYLTMDNPRVGIHDRYVRASFSEASTKTVARDKMLLFAARGSRAPFARAALRIS